MRIEFLWFEGCPNHQAARALLRELLAKRSVDVALEDIEVPDDETGVRVRFPGSPTIRIDGRDIEPGVEECAECTPRCRLYETPLGLRGLPEGAWIEAALDRALANAEAA